MTSKSVHGIYDVMKRDNSLTAGMTLELEMTRARIEPDALEELRICSRSHHLPAHVDPFLSILPRDNAPRHGVIGYLTLPDPQQKSPFNSRRRAS